MDGMEIRHRRLNPSKVLLTERTANIEIEGGYGSPMKDEANSTDYYEIHTIGFEARE